MTARSHDTALSKIQDLTGRARIQGFTGAAIEAGESDGAEMLEESGVRERRWS